MRIQPVLKPEYSWTSGTMSSLLMPWLFASPGYWAAMVLTTVNVANFEHFLEIPFSDTFVLNPM